MLKACLLEDRAVIAIKGAEARDFLQGLVSNDMAQCAGDRAIYAGLLTPQGKILFDFFVLERDAGFLVDCARDRAADLMKRLSLYKLRAKIEIVLRPDLAVAAIWNGDRAMAPGKLGFADPRLPALGVRLIGTASEMQQAIPGTTPGDYTAHRLSLGVPDSADLPSDTVLALDAGFEELHGVSFKKGCYVGQEVTARMKHRSTARKRFLIAESTAALPEGAPITAQERELGTVATGKDGHALALVRLDRLAEAQAAAAPITANGHTIVLRKPAWLALD